MVHSSGKEKHWLGSTSREPSSNEQPNLQIVSSKVLKPNPLLEQHPKQKPILEPVVIKAKETNRQSPRFRFSLFIEPPKV
mmetsp:Transcript_8567/g.10285  ORF Transcript_8567/g.10285 Transcript_8567/m.10285 type:complete len:80 (+) Transcript_8567:245-484(+)